MSRRYLIPLLLMISLVGCTDPSSQKTEKKQDPNVTTEGVRITPDVVYGHKFGLALTFDMYQPKNQNGAGVIWINSGGWQSHLPYLYIQTTEGVSLVSDEALKQMTPNMTSQSIRPLLTKGLTVFTVRHGSRPKFEMHEIVADLRQAIRYIRHYADDYGIHAEKLGLWGASAGGHLALLLGTTADIGNSEVTEEYEKGTGRVKAVVAYFPPTNLEIMAESIRKNNPDVLEQFGLDIADDKLKEFSPINFVSPDDPPTLIIHGEKDPYVPIFNGESMYQALQKVGVESKFVKIPEAGHGFEGEDADQALDNAVNWFEKHLVGK